MGLFFMRISKPLSLSLHRLLHFWWRLDHPFLTQSGSRYGIQCLHDAGHQCLHTCLILKGIPMTDCSTHIRASDAVNSYRILLGRHVLWNTFLHTVSPVTGSAAISEKWIYTQLSFSRWDILAPKYKRIWWSRASTGALQAEDGVVLLDE